MRHISTVFRLLQKWLQSRSELNTLITTSPTAPVWTNLHISVSRLRPHHLINRLIKTNFYQTYFIFVFLFVFVNFDQAESSPKIVFAPICCLFRTEYVKWMNIVSLLDRSLFVERTVAVRLLELSNSLSTYHFSVQTPDGKAFLLVRTTQHNQKNKWLLNTNQVLYYLRNGKRLTVIVSCVAFPRCVQQSEWVNFR